jgi:hypothetical protein
MNQLPLEMHAHIMRMYFTHHVLEELNEREYHPRANNHRAANFVTILDHRILTESKLPQPCPKVMKRLRYARDRWSTHLFSHEQVVHLHRVQ